MPYLQLSSRPLPGTAGRDVVFPFLRQTPHDSSVPDGPADYHFALLVAEANTHARAVLALLGFERDATTTPTGGPGSDWRFHWCSTGPFRPLSDDAADPHARLDTYLQFTWPGGGGDIRKPDALHVVRATLDPTRHNAGYHPDLASFDFDAPSSWSLRFAAVDNTDVVAVAATLPGLTAPLLGFPGVTVTFALVPTPETGTEWAGGRLRVNTTVIDGTASDRVAFDRGALLVRGTSGAPQLVLEIDYTHLVVPLGPGNLARLRLRRQSVAVRHTANGVGIYLLPSRGGGPIRFVVDVEFPLVMAADSKSLPVLLPLIGTTAEDRPPLRYRLVFAVDATWPSQDVPVVLLPRNANTWNWRAFLTAAVAGHWPFDFRDLGTQPLTFGSLEWSLADLLGDARGAVTLRLAPLRRRVAALPLGANATLTTPVELAVNIAGQDLRVELDLVFNLETFRLALNKLDIRLAPDLHEVPVQLIDLGFFALFIPAAPRGGVGSDKHGYLDFDKREFVLRLPGGLPDPLVALPGNLLDDDLTTRVLLKFQPFKPEATLDDDLWLRLSPQGISVSSLVETKHAPVIYNGPGRPISVRPQADRDNVKSGFTIVNNVLHAATVFAEMDVPGFDDLTAKVELTVRQDRRGQPPIVVAKVALDRGSGTPLAQLSIGFLQFTIGGEEYPEPFRAKLTWDTGQNDWDLSVKVDGDLSVAPSTTSAGGLDDLRKRNAIGVCDLDLMALHRGPGSLALKLDKAIEFDCLDGMFRVRLESLTFGWGPKFFFECAEAQFHFNQPGQLEVGVEAGGVRLEFADGRLKMRNPSKLGIEVHVGGAVTFRGQVAWVDTEVEHYFAAAGTLWIDGLPEAKTLLKLGSGVKLNGQPVPNVVLYGAADYELPLFSGVVAKSFGAGIGINNRLTGLGERPNAETMLANIDRIDPSRIEGWEFVRRNGFYLSIIGTTILASNTGPTSTVSAYVAALVLSLDIDLNVAVAGKVWFASSVDFVRRPDNWGRPALVGAIAMVPRARTVSAALESRPAPAIEANDQLARILNNGHVRLSFLMAPRLVDFHLEDVSYRDEFLGVQLLYRGSFRLAVLDGTVLVLLKQTVTGQFDKSLEEGPGGFSASGAIAVGMEIGGLLSGRGLAAYGLLDFSLALQVRAFIRIEFRVTIGWGRWKKKWSYSKTFNLARTRIELGLRGAVAFDESGAFGFDGSLSISVSICSYRLSIAPALRINPDLINTVQARVAAFEQRIAEVRAQLLGGPRTFALATEAATEVWLHYHDTVRNLHLLLPRSDATWFTPKAEKPARPDDPPRFPEGVVSIEVADGGTRLVTVYAPWLRENRDRLPADDRAGLADAVDQAGVWMTETAGSSPAPVSDYVPVRDPRVETASREYWIDEDQARLPAYALPVRFKSADEILSTDEAPPRAGSDHARLVEYLFWSRRAARLRRHSADGVDDDRAARNRGAVVQMLFDAVAAGSPSPNIWTGIPLSTDERFGLWFALPSGTAWSDAFRVSVKRANGTPVDVTVRSPAADLAAVRGAVKPLAARQEFFVDTPGRGERGRVVVKLPFLLPDRVLRDLLPSIRHWRIWRRMPWERDAAVLADYLHPRLDYIEDRPSRVVVVGPYLYSDQFTVEDRKLTMPGVFAGETEIEYFLEPVEVGAPDLPPSATMPRGLPAWPRVKLFVPPPDAFPADLVMLWPARSIYHGGTDWGRFGLAVAADDPEEAGRLRPAVLGSAPLQVEDFELWTEEADLPGSGFYAGGDDPRQRPAAATNAGLTDLRAGRVQRPTESPLGKAKIAVLADGDGAFRIDVAHSPPFRTGRAYRFFVRPRLGRPDSPQREGVGPLRPLTTFLALALPPVQSRTIDTRTVTEWLESPKLRTVTAIEFVPDATRAACLAGSVVELPVTAAHRTFDPQALPDRLRERIGVEWDLNRVNVTPAVSPVGGVELWFADRDDSAVRGRVLCETPHAAAFRQMVPDFRNASAWRLTPREQWHRRNFQHDPNPLPAPSGDLTGFFLYEGDNPLLEDFDRRASELLAALRGRAWLTVLPAAKNFLTAVRAYRKSPLNLNDKPLRDAYDRLEFLFKYLFAGASDPAVDSSDKLTAEACRRIEASVASALADAEKASADALPPTADDEEGEQAARLAFLDLDTAKKLAAIVRRRLAAAAEIFSNEDDDVPRADSSDTEWLPRRARFEELRQYASEQKLPERGLTAPLKSRFPATRADGTDDWAARLLLKVIENLQDLVHYRDASRRQPAAGIVAQAAGLTAALVRLRAACAGVGWRLLRRPHHQVTLGETDTGERRAETTRLADLSSDAVRLDSATGAAEAGATPTTELPALLNLLERLGFAVDVAAVDVLGAVVEQDDLARLVEAADLPAALPSGVPHRTYLVLGREPDSEHHGDFPDGAEPSYYVGYSFAKLVAMPVAFAERLSARFWPLPTDADSDPAKTLVELRKWFELRGIEAKDPAAVSLLRRFGALVAYLDHPPTNGLRRVRLESSDSRWVTVPLTDGRGHIDWPLPDRKGRRLRPPAARLVSRYEPLVRWAERHYRPVEWTPADTEPDLVVRRIVTNDDRGAGLDLPEWLPVAVHPHPDELRFSVTLPSAAARSMANAISAVRTGYAGYTLAFRYRLRDHDTPGERGWQKLLEAMQFTADTLPDPPSVVEPTPGRAGREPRLFRHERLVSLDRWPFIHECWLVARSQYDVRRLDTIGAGHTKPTFGEPARREPGFLAVRRPLVVADGTATWKVTFYLTRTGDLLTPLELAASPPLLPKSAAVPGAGHTVDFPPDGLPEPSSGYHLYYRVPSPSGDVYLAVAELLMPWHTRYAVPEGDLRPWCRPLDSRVSIDEERPKVVCGSSTGSSTFTPAYTVTVRLTIRRGAGDQELLFADADRRVVTVTRNGRCSSAILTT